MPDHDLKRGAWYMIAAALAFSLMGVLVKLASATLPSETIVFFRSLVGLVALLPLIQRRGWTSLRTRRLGLHLSRGLSGLAAMICFFYAIAHIPLAEATLFVYSTPLFVPFIARIWLGEVVPRALWWAIGVGYLGLLLILKPGFALFTPVSLIALAAGLFAAFAMVCVRRLTRSEPSARIVFYFSLTCAVGSALLIPWRWPAPTGSLWLLLIAIGVLATAGQLLLTRAYAHAPASQIGPFSYATVVFAAAWGWIGFNELLDLYSLTGTALVVLAGAWTLRHLPSTLDGGAAFSGSAASDTPTAGKGR